MKPDRKRLDNVRVGPLPAEGQAQSVNPPMTRFRFGIIGWKTPWASLDSLPSFHISA